ncbi:MAG: hypothetical protein Q4E94_07145, partial [Clostridia bacterium]|nr:hypothetical protein [Clostridia bacterium]
MITLLKTLDRLGHETVFLTPYPDSYFNELSLKHSENQYTLPEPSEYLRKYYKNRVKASLAFRTERLMRRVALHRIITRFTHLFKDSDVVWLLSENTALLAGKHFVDRLGSFLYTMYELRIANKKVPAVYDYAARKALLTVVPEYSRAHIVNAFYGLGQMPSIIPNKPDTHPRTKNMAISDPRIAEEIRSIHETGKKIIMYMGILSNERPLEPIIDALKYN